MRNEQEIRNLISMIRHKKKVTGSWIELYVFHTLEMTLQWALDERNGNPAELFRGDDFQVDDNDDELGLF